MTQTAVCRSRALLPTCLGIAGLVWWLSAGAEPLLSLLGFACTALTAAILLELTNRNALIRVYSRSVSSLFMLTSAAAAFMHELSHSSVAALCLAVAIFLTLRIDMGRTYVVDTFHVMLFLCLAALCVPELVAVVPLFFIYIGVMRRAMSLRALCAGLIGLALPLLAFWAIELEGLPNLGIKISILWRQDILRLEPLSVEAWQGTPLSVWIGIAALSIVSAVHYAAHVFADKVRTRTLMQILYVQTTAMILLAALKPAAAERLVAPALVSFCPLVGHHLTLSRSLAALVVAWLLALALVALALWTMEPGLIMTLINLM